MRVLWVKIPATAWVSWLKRFSHPSSHGCAHAPAPLLRGLWVQIPAIAWVARFDLAILHWLFSLGSRVGSWAVKIWGRLYIAWFDRPLSWHVKLNAG